MNNLLHKYGNTALIAGASEGLGAAFAAYLGAAGMNLVLVARREKTLEKFAADLRSSFNIDVDCICCDLADVNATDYLQEAIGKKEINLLVYNAALSHIGAFEKQSLESYTKTTQVNMITPMKLFHVFGEAMLTKGKGALIMMASLAGFQGSGFLTVYAATKAFDRVLAESLWYEWKDRGVDVIACCAGATSTPNFIKTKPGKKIFFHLKFKRPKKWWKNAFAN